MNSFKAAGRRRLFERLERFIDEQKSADDEKKALLRKIETFENRLAMANQALYGGGKTCNDKYSDGRTSGTFLI